MSRRVHDPRDASAFSQTSETEPPIASLVVHLRREAHRCIASFSGALTAATRTTIDGVADLIAGEESVVFDFSRIDVVDAGGADAVEVLVSSVRDHGGRFQLAGWRGRTGAPRRARAKGYRPIPARFCGGFDQ